MKGQEVIKTVSRKFNLLVIRLRNNKITGIDLIHDLNQIILKDNPLIFDVGANIGQSIEMFKGIWKNAIVHSFEPSNKLFNILKTHKYDKTIFLNNTAVGSQIEKRVFNLNQKSGLNSFLDLDPSEENRFRNKEVIAKEETLIDTIDSYILKNNITYIDLLKTDTQGFDFEVLKGAIKTFSEKKVHSILIEINFLPMYIGQAKSGEIIDFLSANNFNLVGLYEVSRRGNSIAWCTALFTVRS